MIKSERLEYKSIQDLLDQHDKAPRKGVTEEDVQQLKNKLLKK